MSGSAHQGIHGNLAPCVFPRLPESATGAPGPPVIQSSQRRTTAARARELLQTPSRAFLSRCRLCAVFLSVPVMWGRGTARMTRLCRQCLAPITERKGTKWPQVCSADCRKKHRLAWQVQYHRMHREQSLVYHRKYYQTKREAQGFSYQPAPPRRHSHTTALTRLCPCPSCGEGGL